MKFPRRNFLHLAAGAVVLPAVSLVARAQDYPTRPCEILARINDDDRAKACRSAIFHDYGMQVGIPVPH